MPCKKSMSSIYIGSICAFVLGTVPIALAVNNSIAAQSVDKGFMVAEAHQHGVYADSKDQCSQKSKSGGMMGHMRGRMRHGGGYSYAHMVATHADELELSDAQLGRIVRLHMKHAQEHKQFKRRIRKSMMQLHHESMKPSTDDATLRKLGNDHIEAFKAMLEQQIRDRNVVHAILSSDQRNQLKTMKMDHGMHGGGYGKHSSKHGKHGGNYGQHYY